MVCLVTNHCNQHKYTDVFIMHLLTNISQFRHHLV